MIVGIIILLVQFISIVQLVVSREMIRENLRNQIDNKERLQIKVSQLEEELKKAQA